MLPLLLTEHHLFKFLILALEFLKLSDYVLCLERHGTVLLPRIGHLEIVNQTRPSILNWLNVDDPAGHGLSDSLGVNGPCVLGMATLPVVGLIQLLLDRLRREPPARRRRRLRPRIVACDLIARVLLATVGPPLASQGRDRLTRLVRRLPCPVVRPRPLPLPRRRTLDAHLLESVLKLPYLLLQLRVLGLERVPYPVGRTDDIHNF